MESDDYGSELQSDDSIYRYLHSQKNRDEEENDTERNQDNEEWDDYFLDSSRLDLSIFSEKGQIEEVVSSNLEQDSSWNLQKDTDVSKSSIAEQRLEMISQLKNLSEEYKQLKLKNSFLHKKCRDIFIKLKIMNHLERWGFDSEIHNDKRYIEVLEEFEAIRENKKRTEDCYEQELKKMEDSYQLQCSEFQEAFQEFTSRELEIGATCISRETKKITNAPIMNLLNKQKQRLNILSRVRVTYLKLRNLLESIRTKLDNKNILGGGYTMIKYENLMMNKNILSEKVDERVKELEIIRDKFFSIVHILAHVREVSVGFSRKIEEAAVESAESENLRREKRLELGKQRNLIRKQILNNKQFIDPRISNRASVVQSMGLSK